MVKILLKQFVELNEADFHFGDYVNKQNCRIWDKMIELPKND